MGLLGRDNPHQVLPGQLRCHAEGSQRLHGNALLLRQQPEQDVLNTEIRVPERLRLLRRQLQSLAGLFRVFLEHAPRISPRTKGGNGRQVAWRTAGWTNCGNIVPETGTGLPQFARVAFDCARRVMPAG